jgi:hypothetical protein
MMVMMMMMMIIDSNSQKILLARDGWGIWHVRERQEVRSGVW